MKAKIQTAYFAIVPSIFAERRFNAFDPAFTALDKASATTVAIIKINAATIIFGKNPSTSSVKKEEMYVKPTKLSEGNKKMIIINHFAICSR